MKRNIYIILALLAFGSIKAQVKVHSNPDPVINTHNPFLDASSYTDGWGVSEAKGLLFPQVDLTTFQLNAAAVDEFMFPTAYDGMIVYNIGTGNTSDGALNAQSAVKPGFYYFHNPQGKGLVASNVTGNATVAQGKWIPLGAGGSVEIKTAPSVIGKVDGADLYAVKGNFTAPGGATVTIPNLNTLGITSIYSIKIYKGGTKKLVASSLSSYDVANNKVVIGVGNMTMSLEATNYDYVLEYFK